MRSVGLLPGPLHRCFGIDVAADLAGEPAAKDARLVGRTVNEHVDFPGTSKLRLEAVPLRRNPLQFEELPGLYGDVEPQASVRLDLGLDPRIGMPRLMAVGSIRPERHVWLNRDGSGRWLLLETIHDRPERPNLAREISDRLLEIVQTFLQHRWGSGSGAPKPAPDGVLGATKVAAVPRRRDRIRAE